MDVFIYIFKNNIVPIFLIMGMGFFLGKKFNIDVLSLSKICFYVFVPSFMFVYLYTTPFSMEMVKITCFVVIMIIACDILARVAAKVRGYDVSMANAFKNSIIFNNSGNIGVSLVTLIFAGGAFVVDGKTPYLDAALSTQVVILILQNIFMYSLGFFYAGQAASKTTDSLKKIFAMPSIYVVPVVVFCRVVEFDVASTVLWPALEYTKNGLVPMALLTLGVQLSRVTYDFTSVDTYLSVFLKLIVSPVMAIVFIYLFGFTGVVAQTLFISFAVPTAVNTALIAIEFKNQPDFASQAVMMSTIFSTITLTFFIYAARIIFPV